MHVLRALTCGNRCLAILVIALVLGVKALLPSGYMLADSTRVLTVTLCNGGDGASATARIALPVKGAPDDGSSPHGKADGHCPYSSLSMAAMGGAPAPLLALAFAFILALGLASAQWPLLGQHPYLRPPLRGPPSAA